MDDYIVRYGNDKGVTQRSDYMTETAAKHFYNKIELSEKITWKELIYEPLNEEEVQQIIKSDSVKVVDLGICTIVVPE